MVNNYDVIIIGSGAAGLFSAISIKNKKVLILEKNSTPGKKLLISGACQCNYTNYCNLNEFLTRYGNKGRFLKPALYNFTCEDTINFFKQLGVESIIRDDKKVFPKSLKAIDILNALIKKCKENGVDIIYNKSALKVEYDFINNLFTVITSDALFKCPILIIATGGKSYPQTGSAGDGYIFAESLGHKIEKTKPALSPVYIENYNFQDLSGVSCKDIQLTLWRNNKKISSFKGDMLFTHKNISGPVIINNSRYIEKGDILKVNFTGFSNNDEFKSFLEQEIMSSGKLNIKTVIYKLNIPKRLAEKILELAKISDFKICSELDKSSRKKLIELLSNYPMKVFRLGDYNTAMVTKGGVSTEEINSKTMESKIIKNLYFAGEVIDIDGETGGFNIQAAFSTGKLVGDSLTKLNQKRLN